MYCKLCIKHNKRPFNRDTWNLTPCTRYRLHSVLSHEKCSAPQDSVKLEAAACASVNICQAIQLPLVPARGLEQAFSCLYWLAKQRIAHVWNFEPVLNLLKFLGLDVKGDIHVAKNATYMSNKSIQDMLYCLSEVIETGILNSMKESKHVSIMFDETTDCTITEQLAVHGRFINKDTGDLESHFLKVIDVLVPENANVNYEDQEETERAISVSATTITKRIFEYTEKAGFDMDKLRGVGTDGAATMLGCKSGVVVRLKEQTPTLIGVHCAEHTD